jgi:hypothetical protein
MNHQSAQRSHYLLLPDRYELHEEYFRYFEANMPMDGAAQRRREKEYTVFHPPRDQTNAIQ